LLQPSCPGYKVFDKRFNFLFNSYYEAVGARHARPERGFLTRPSLETIFEYRAHVTAAVSEFLETGLKRRAPQRRCRFWKPASLTKNSIRSSSSPTSSMC
jgi:hypothetical protein